MLFSHKTRWRSTLHFNFSRPIHLLAQPIWNSAGMSVCRHRADSSCIPTWFARLSSTVSTISHISAIQIQKIKHKIAHALFPSIVSFFCCCCGVLFNLWISMLKSNTPRNVFTIYSSEKPLCTHSVFGRRKCVKYFVWFWPLTDWPSTWFSNVRSLELSIDSHLFADSEFHTLM